MMTEKTGEFAVQPAEQSAADYEYNTLMRLLGVSVSKHLMDEHFTLIWANDFFYELLGYPREEYEATFHNYPDLYFQGGDKKEWDALVNAVMDAIAAHQNGYSLVSRLKRKNGEYIWVKYIATFSEEYVDGYQVSYTVITNIDDLVRMQQERTVTYDNLPGFVAKFRIEPDGPKFLEANDRFNEFFGCREAGFSCSLSNYDSEKNMATYKQNLPLMREGKSVHFTLQAKDHSGGNMWLQVNADCIEWVNGMPIYLVIYIDITDITEQRELQKQLEERTEMLQQANKSKSEFLSRMSHDIRTPMNAIMGMTDIAVSHIDNKERVLDCLSKIKVSSKLLLSLINEVLDMSKIESGRITMEEKEFSLSEVLHSIIMIMQPSILEKKHFFDIHAYELQHELVVGDPQRIEQVFLNILSNAVKYTPDGGKILLEIRELPTEKAGYGCYEFIFEDNGYGMKPDFLEKIFTPFERAKDASIYAIQGTGLGMAISRNIVRMMDGDITVESTYGKGSKVTITVYLKLQDKTAAGFDFSSDLPVLVVDDDQIACETTCGRLEELGIAGRWVLSGEEAISELETARRTGKHFLAVIMDLKMPVMDGIETARRIRREVGSEIPIIMLTAYDWTEFEEEAAAAGVNGFIAKPMLKSTLSYAIKRYVLKENMPEKSADSGLGKRSFAGHRLLLVEDNELNQEIAIEVLGRTGISIETAVNGLEAVEKFMDSPDGYYDLIFMDLQMPVMGGLEAACRIRASKKQDAKSVPIVAMTANVFAEDVAEANAAGMNGHLAKPLDLELIEQVMEKYIPESPDQSE